MKESYTKTINDKAAIKATERLDKLLSFILLESPEDETWKEISWADNGEYWVSDKGRILSFYNSSPKIMKPFVCGGGYYYITIYGHDRRIHRLVA